MSKKTYNKKAYHKRIYRKRIGLKGAIRILHKRLYKLADCFLFWPSKIMDKTARGWAAEAGDWGYQTDEVKRNIMISGAGTGCIFVLLWWIFLAVLLIAAIVYLIIKFF